ncbi:MAG: uracil-DNA glycosylase [Chitinispirillales bacterium]|nr:uracil-DNA glycosylase [Chitinispirillales bacterium]
MTNNIYSIITAYFQYQRDLGVSELFFTHESEIKRLLADGVSLSIQKSIQTSTQAPRVRGGGVVDSSPPSKLPGLSGLRPVDELGLKSIEGIAPRVKAGSVKREKLAELYREVLGCDKCTLSQSRAKVVFGSGSADGRLFVIGGAPSPQDEDAGRPFQGEPGGLFEKILGKMGLDRGADIFTAHLQKCFNAGGYEGYDGGGDGFDSGYAEACKSTLDRQIDIIEPRAVLIFGRQAANFLLGTDYNIEQLRSANYIYKGRPTVVSYDLSLLLRETQYRHGAWVDMKKVLELI